SRPQQIQFVAGFGLIEEVTRACVAFLGFIKEDYRLSGHRVRKKIEDDRAVCGDDDLLSLSAETDQEVDQLLHERGIHSVLDFIKEEKLMFCREALRQNGQDSEQAIVEVCRCGAEIALVGFLHPQFSPSKAERLYL